MTVLNYLTLLGGVAIFLFGMTLMGDGLKKVAGSKLELILFRLTSNPIKGILLGTGVTAVIQSSSATSIMVVGFVNSQIMKVRQGIGIIMGAIIGTSITGWIICLSNMDGSGFFKYISSDALTTLIAVVAVLMLMTARSESQKQVSNVLFGFVILMMGISMMSESVTPLRESEEFIGALTEFNNPLIGILVGTLFTCIIQSASASVGILQALSVTGCINFRLALPLIMGIAIGASLPVLLSALGANADGKRTALIYLFVDLFGVILASAVFYTLNSIFDFEFMRTTLNMQNIAMLNTVFRLIIVVAQVPLIGLHERLVRLIVKDENSDLGELRDVDRLEERFLSHPSLAIEQTRITINSMAQLAVKNLEKAIHLFEEYNDLEFKKVDSIETVMDRYEDKLGNYIVKIMRAELSNEQNKAASMYLHCVNDFERISDHAKNLSESAREMHLKKMKFTDMANHEMANLFAAVREILDITFKAFVENDIESIYRIEPLEETIDVLCDEYKVRHIERVQHGECRYDHGYVFNDMLTDLERVGDHCSNIGIAIKMDNDALVEKRGIEFMREMEHQHGFDKYYKEYLQKYNISDK